MSMRRSVLSFVVAPAFPLAPLAVVVCLGLAACSSDAGTQRIDERDYPDRTVRSSEPSAALDASSSDAELEAGDAGEVGSGSRVNLGKTASDELTEFLDSESLLFGDVVEIHMSRKPFLSKTTFSSSPDKVLRTETIDGVRGLLTITLQNRTNMKAILSELPNVRIGDGMEIVGTERIVLHYWTRQTKERPVHFKAVAQGGREPAMYKPGLSSPAERAALLEVNAEVRQSGNGYRFNRTWTQTTR